MNKREMPLEQMMPLILERLSQGGEVKISPKGISMLPMLRQGTDSVILSPLPKKLKKYDLPLYRREDGKYVLHRIIEVGHEFTCMGDNQFVAEKNVKSEQMLALVTAFYRGNKLWKVKNPIYMFYCRLWYHSRNLRKLLKRIKNKMAHYLKK